MHVGMGFFFQGGDDRTDHQVYAQQLDFLDQAEARGFESIWTAEHHFTGYQMMPNPVQFLTYAAAKTKEARLGTMVMVLPWHDPIRVAEEVAFLDTVSQGRAVLGVGRGLGPIEFDNFRLEMGESRQRFTEYAKAISDSLETGVIEADGELYKQPAAEIHPPAFSTFRGRTYAAAVSPESAEIVARLGYGLMLIAQKPWETVLAETESYRNLFIELNGHEPPQPVLVNFTSVDPDRERAKEIHEEYALAYSASAVEHYDFTNPRLETVNGYEYYAGLRRNIEKHGLPTFTRFLADLQMRGTPDDLVEQTIERARALNAGGVVNIFDFGCMPFEVARRNVEIYAEKVLPRLREIDTFRDICTPIQESSTVA
jgi:alkanesulfonate monooxygenase SsuD/methylene tetrahydromethanopterin reductase-like flavin-dependent oxidoreductase (luciferase family)